MKPMALTVPAREEWILVLRMAMSGVSALYGVPVDVMDDLNTAVEESCDLLLHQDYTADTLTLRCEERPDGLHVTLNAEGGTDRPEEQPADADIARLIIQTLVRDVTLEEDAGSVRCVHMTLPARM
ncbi:MAG: hypothetical protein IKP32_07595 [Clostridia bacterium]|jgi:anti-sigma regulatory factor (Ser/Thr protein kinase)|nr:hypothetical protein [Clostridia bacterium]